MKASGRFPGAVLALVLSVAAVAGVLGYRHFESGTEQSATNLQLSRLDGPGTRSIADWHGTPVVVNLFASWIIVGVDSQDSPAAGLSLARRLGITYPLLADTSHADLYRLLQAEGMPVTAFVDRNGTVKRVYSGELDEALLGQLIDQLLQT